MDSTYVYRLPRNVLDTLKLRGSAAEQEVPDTIAADDSSDPGTSSEEELDSSPSNNLQEVLSAALSPNPGSPITWFTSDAVPSPTKLGVYTAMLPPTECSIKSLQITDNKERTIAMFMVGGGHVQGTIISLNESSVAKCVIKASKGFHRYTTRRKQGGSQSANDNAKGAANSAGAQIRRYNEVALADDVRGLLREWTDMLATVEVILVRASGQSSRKLLYDNGLNRNDPRIRGFPLNTRRATQAEIIRTFHILTRLQIGSVLDDVVPSKLPAREVQRPHIAETPKIDSELITHTEKLTTLIKKDKAALVKGYANDHALALSEFVLEPRKTYIHTPTLLHYASANDSTHAILLLLDLGSDPRRINSSGKTAFEVAASKKARDNFRLWRGLEGNEDRWDWESARVPDALTQKQIAARQQKEAEDRMTEEKAEALRRKEETTRLEAEIQEARERDRQEADRKRGPGRSLIAGVSATPTHTSLDGLTPQMKQKIERERRARAAEARFKK